jgi:peptide/nickel transport system substrate-binding protein
MRRRQFLGTAAAGLAAGTLAAPRVARADAARVLKFVPQADLAVLDPIWTTAYVTRNHGLMVFDQLYGYDDSFAPQPQMVAGHTTEDDGRTWTLTLRDGLQFHDNAPVLARDCVASIRRWGKRDSFGQTLMAATDELSAPDDRTIRFRLKQPFPLLPAALGKPGSNVCAIMPQRLAETDAFTQIKEIVGSGPFRFKTDERVPGSLVVYERFAAYRPRPDGAPRFTSGPKVANFDRVEWHVIPDGATAAAALQTGEIDWWEYPTTDLAPMLANDRKLRVEIVDKLGQMACLRLNHLNPPFDNPAIRRALLLAVSQEDTMIAVAGDDTKLRHVPAGIFTPNTAMASMAGLDVLMRPRDYAAAKAAITAAGYKGERVALMVPTDFPSLKALADVTADMMGKMGLNVDYQGIDWGTVVQRRAKKDPVDKGGWSAFCTFWSGLDQSNPAVHAFLRGQGESGTMGWPSSPKIEALRSEWIATSDFAKQKQIAEQLQLQALEDVPYVPLGQNFYQTAFRNDISGILPGFVMFWNVKRG